MSYRDYEHRRDDGAARRMALRRKIYRMEEERLEMLQAKSGTGPEISQTGDKHEQEADAVAKKVVSTDHTNISADDITSSTTTIQSQEEDTPLMAKREGGALHGTEQLQSQLDSTKGSGQALDDQTKSEMESKMNADLGDVRIHTDSKAHEMSEGINAKAFTHGQDIYFKNGNFDPGSKDGKELLAHELAHTQQQKGVIRPLIQRDPTTDPDPIEDARKNIEAYLNQKDGVLSSIREIPLETKHVNVYIKVWNEQGNLYFFRLILSESHQKQVEIISQDQYEINTGINQVAPLSAHNDKGYRAEIIVSGILLNEVPVEAYDKKRLEKLREYAENDSGLGGFFYNYPEEDAALLFASFNPAEREEIAKDKELLKQIGSRLDNAQYARGLENLDLSLDEKLDLLWEGRTSFSGRGAAFEDLRGLLLSCGEEGKLLHDRLAKVFSVKDTLRIDFLMDESLLQRYISSQARYHSSKKPGDLLFDDKLDSKVIGLTPAESSLVSNIISKKKSLGQLTEEEKIQYLTAFKRNALKVTFEMLDLSERTVFESSNRLLKGEAEKIKNALAENESTFKRMNELDSEISRKGVTSHEDAAVYAAYQEQQAARAEKDALEDMIRKKLAEKAPILVDPKINLQSLYNKYAHDENAEDIEKHLRKRLGSVFQNIEETKRIMREDPDQVYKLEGVIKRTKEIMAMPLPVFDKIVDEKIEDVAWNEFMLSIGMAIVSIGLAAASFGTLTPFAAALLATSSFVVSGIDFYFTYQDYKFKSTAGGTSIDPELALTFSDPSVIWVIASLAGAVADVASVAKVVKLVPSFAKTGEGASEIAAELKRLGKITEGMSEADIIKLLERARRFKQTIQAQLFNMMQGRSINLNELNELADIYLAERFDELNKLDSIDDFVKNDLPSWYEGKVKEVNEPKVKEKQQEGLEEQVKEQPGGLDDVVKKVEDKKKVPVGITLKHDAPQDDIGRYFASTITSDGKIKFFDRKYTDGVFDFIITQDGKLHFGKGHFFLYQKTGGENVLAAGQIKIRNGTVKSINNLSGHFQPTVDEMKNTRNLFESAGVSLDQARIELAIFNENEDIAKWLDEFGNEIKK